ncbi:Pyruvate/Phosphoenolpyruvate kinase-like domain-containing protein [Rhodotorula toruloides]|uniref:Pyruvate/Phosphoenolpyruvate kinase-like domain-containing protein n=1 Tax=Rhodotorula toruloides TaxID=5286 RepID=A0A2T0A116_RHOTO|nr:Pyruvate/Phosphoenolpyruvate kinase-like domain-containing protein [Rhodotorula toruloides]PRQ71707.1 Pyruvate/Phosphoenolpyruvate kinase-like domain-containing protein [Rhodotorula toruloides]
MLKSGPRFFTTRQAARTLLPHLACPSPTSFISQRPYSAAHASPALSAARAPQRALLYVPGSNEKALKKALGGGLTGEDAPDVVTLDLEDSVRTEKKTEARRLVREALENAPGALKSKRFVRINPGQAGLDDLEAVLQSPRIDGMILPKVNTAQDLLAVHDFIDRHSPHAEHKSSLKLIASIESPKALLNMQEIASCSDKVGGLLFGAEDYCAASRLIRTPSRREMLFARSSIVTVAHAYGLAAIDLVCVKYKGEEAQQVLVDECREGREMGFTGKQAIHPAQVSTIQRAFAPSPAEIERAQAILAQYAEVSTTGAGAYGLKNADGGVDMIDAPMLLQAQSIIAQAEAAGLL